MDRLSDEELDAYAVHAMLEGNRPLAAVVAELQQARLVLAHVHATLPRVYVRLEHVETLLEQVRGTLAPPRGA